MQPQYIYDDSVTPPAQSTLQYTIAPDTLWITTSNSTQTVISLIITVYNNTGNPVNCNFFTFGILQGTTEGSLTPDATSVTGTSDQPSNWSAPVLQTGGDPNYPNYYLYKTTPVGGQMKVMQPGDTLIFRLDNIKVTNVQGTSQIFIREKANDNIVTGTLADTILNNNTLQIVANSFESSPGAPINPGDAASLSWAILNADHWKLFDNDTAALLYNGNAASTYPTGTQPYRPLENTNYKLIAYADVGETQHVSDYTSVMVNPITLNASINGQQQVTVDANTQQTINWSTQLANRVKLHATDGTPDQVRTVPPAGGGGTFQITPTQNTTYIVSSYYEDDSQNPPVTSTPVTQEIDVYVNAPYNIHYAVSTLVPSQDAPVTFSWQAQSTSRCTITPNGGTFTGAQALNGSTQVTPPRDTPTPYLLTLSAGEASVPQPLGTVRPMLHGWNNITWPSDWVYSFQPYLLNFNWQLWLVDNSMSAMGTPPTFNVWKTADEGVTWTNVPVVNPPSPREGGYMVVFDDGHGHGEKMWRLGGRPPLQSAVNEIWCSSDGANWTQVQTSGTVWAGRTSHACAVFNNKLWVLGGANFYPYPPGVSAGGAPSYRPPLWYKDVWSSRDGINWTQHATPPWSANIDLVAAVFNGKLWVCGGRTMDVHDTNTFYAEAWSTSDGDSWTQWNNGATPPQTATPWGPRTVTALLTPNDHLWLLGGVGPGFTYLNDMWTMDVHGTWTKVADTFLIYDTKAFAVFDWRIWLLNNWQANLPVGSTGGRAAAYYVP